MAKQEAVRVTGLNKWFGDFQALKNVDLTVSYGCLLYTSPSPRDVEESRMPSSA